MSQIDKLLARLKQGEGDFRWEDAEKLLGHFGYEVDESRSGSRVVFIHPGYKCKILLHKPHGGSGTQMKKYAQKDLLQHLEEWGHISDE